MVGGDEQAHQGRAAVLSGRRQPGQPYGLNSVGLRRAAFSVEERNEIKKFYKILYDPKLNVSQAIEAMKAEVATDPGREILAFLESPSERGVLK